MTDVQNADASKEDVTKMSSEDTEKAKEVTSETVQHNGEKHKEKDIKPADEGQKETSSLDNENKTTTGASDSAHKEEKQAANEDVGVPEGKPTSDEDTTADADKQNVEDVPIAESGDDKESNVNNTEPEKTADAKADVENMDTSADAQEGSDDNVKEADCKPDSPAADSAVKQDEAADTPVEHTTAPSADAEMQESSVDKSSAEKASVEEPSVEEPSVEEPSVKEPSDEEASDEKASEEKTSEEKPDVKLPKKRVTPAKKRRGRRKDPTVNKSSKAAQVENKSPKADQVENKSPKAAQVEKKSPKAAQVENKSPKAAQVESKSPKAAQVENQESGEEDTGAVDEAMDTEEASDAPSTSKLGLVERPVEIMTGKRNRRKVDRLAENIATSPATPADKKKFTIPEGEGVKLGDCPAIEEIINRTKANELKAFHKLLYGSPGKTPTEIKKNVRGFCGWTFVVDDAEYKKKKTVLSKINMPVIKSWCSMLKLTVGGTKDTLVERIMGYLMKPTADGKEQQAKEKKSETGKRKRAAVKESTDDAEESEEETVQSEEDSEDEPMSKKRKTSARKTPAKQSKTPVRPGRARRGRAVKSAAVVEEEDDEDGPPSDAAIKKQIEKILSTADLEIVTMKTVRQQILDMYSEHDLTGRKDFIKATVKQILGA